MKLLYQFKYLPAGLFNRAQSRLCQYSDSVAIWKKGSLLHKNNHIALLRQTKNQELVLIVQGPKPENVLFLVHEASIPLITACHFDKKKLVIGTGGFNNRVFSRCELRLVDSLYRLCSRRFTGSTHVLIEKRQKSN